MRWQSYIAVLDFNAFSGRLHRHVVAIGGPVLHRSLLTEHVRRAGLGHIDVRAIGDSPQDRTRIANYVASNGVHFAAVHAKPGRRVQPFSRSHSR